MQNQKVLPFMEAKGVIEYNMTNNYMFRFILQKNQKVLKGLICALLHLKPEQIKSIEIVNPINLAGDMGGKEFILDINVMLNDDTLINLEMQVANEHNWPERSLMYLCRAFDQLYRGQKYEDSRPVIHIGFLDYTLFKKYPEFYATYKLMNVKNHNTYSSKFVLSVIDLSKTELATEEDKFYGIDYWARVFKAKTWEELKMWAENDEYLKEAADSLYMANADEIVRQQCRAREDAERRERTLERDNKILREVKEALEKETARLQETKTALQEETIALQEDNAALQEDNAALQEDNAILLEKIEILKKRIAELEANK